MDAQQEAQVLSGLYDRLLDAITYSPGSQQPSAFDKNTTLLQFSKNEAVNPGDFADATTPSNPGGRLDTAESFARLVDTVPTVEGTYTPSGNSVSAVYENIVNGANTAETTDPAQVKIYQQAYKFLNTTTKIKDFTGAETTAVGPSPIAAAYQANQSSYIAAVSAYRTAYLDYDLTDVKQQRQWQANEPLLSNAVSRSYSTWRNQGAPQVEQAQAALVSSINSSIANAIAEAQEAVSDIHKLASNLPSGTDWFMSYAFPGNWADPAAAANFSSLTLDSSNIHTTTDSSSTSYGGGASFGEGLWSVGASAEHSEDSSSFHMDADQLKLSAKIGLVRIYRPWLHEFLFRMKGWWINSREAGGISNGMLTGNSNGLLPLLPTAFVVARDVSISANFSTQDQTHIASATSGSASVGWGPFAVSGHYSHSESHDTFNATFNGGTLTIPGIQIVGWVSEIVPSCPPLSKPA